MFSFRFFVPVVRHMTMLLRYMTPFERKLFLFVYGLCFFIIGVSWLPAVVYALVTTHDPFVAIVGTTFAYLVLIVNCLFNLYYIAFWSWSRVYGFRYTVKRVYRTLRPHH